jgi:hypothetical protein
MDQAHKPMTGRSFISHVPEVAAAERINLKKEKKQLNESLHDLSQLKITTSYNQRRFVLPLPN